MAQTLVILPVTPKCQGASTHFFNFQWSFVQELDSFYPNHLTNDVLSRVSHTPTDCFEMWFEGLKMRDTRRSLVGWIVCCIARVMSYSTLQRPVLWSWICSYRGDFRFYAGFSILQSWFSTYRVKSWWRLSSIFYLPTGENHQVNSCWTANLLWNRWSSR